MKPLMLDKEFDRFFDKIYNKENFTFLRYGGGERLIMSNLHVVGEDNWEIVSNERFAKYLLQTLEINDERVWYGISCPCCDKISYLFYQTHITSKNISFANLFVNINYKRFKQYFENIQEDAILIANYKAKDKKIGNLNILKHYELQDDCNSFFDNGLNDFINNIKDDFGNKNNILYVVSAGPLSEIIIYELFKHNPNNRYIDFGSSIDFYFKESIELRPYTTQNNIYAQRNCYMCIGGGGMYAV